MSEESKQVLKVNLGIYTGIEIEKPKKPFTITENEVDETLKNYQQRLAQKVEKPSDATIEMGDYVTFDFENWINDQLFPNSHIENAHVVIGSNRLMPGVEEEMVGLKRGPEQVISFLMPAETNQLLHQLVKDNYFGKETTTVANILDNLKVGQQIEVHLNIKNIESLQLAPANDEFAQKLGFDDLTSLRQQISKDLVKRTEDDFLDQLMNKIVIGSEFEIPEALIQKEIDHELSNLVLELTKQGKTLADYQKELNFNSSEEFNQQLRHQSTYNLKVQLVSLEIINQENLIVTDQEVEDFYNKIAVQEKVDLDFIRQQVNQEQLKNQLMTEKLISFLIENNG